MFTFNVDNVEYKVKFHYSPYNENKSKKTPKRTTTCTIRNEENLQFTIGESQCSKKDNFCRATGRELAMARALSDLFPGIEGKEKRSQIWMQYFMKLQNDQINGKMQDFIEY